MISPSPLEVPGLLARVPYLPREGVLATVREAMRRDPPTEEIVAAILFARDRGMADLAEQLLRETIDQRPPCSAAYYELAFLLRLRGEHRAAATLLARSLRAAGEDVRTRVFLAHMLFALGAHEEAERLLDTTRAGDEEEMLEIGVMFELGAFLRAYPLGRALFLLEEVKARHRYLDTAETAAEIAEAQQQRRPFALIRAGDGEGSLLTFGNADEHAYRLLYARNRAEFAAIWFGEEFPVAGSAFFGGIRDLSRDLLESSVLGIPYETWIRHEYAICSPRGIPSLVNVLRSVLGAGALPDLAVTDQNVHVNLHLSGRLAPVVRAAQRVTVISCHDGLPALLTERLQLDEVALLRIPGEHGSAAVLGPERIAGTHYPDMFTQLQTELSRPHDGRLFLVAAGVLGKFYASTIRRHGGVAIDIGSLADAWIGCYTRPGYGPAMRL
jgi:hypothetical protein